MSLSVKKGDTALVIAGKEKGKKAKITAVLPKDNKVVLDNVNVVTRHRKPRTQQDKSAGEQKMSAPLDASNVMVICPSCDKATRVAHKEIDGKKVRVCKKCSASLDKAFVKTVKKQAKAEATEKKAAAKTGKKTAGKEETALEAIAPKKAAAPKPAAEKKAVVPKATAQKSKTHNVSTKLGGK